MASTGLIHYPEDLSLPGAIQPIVDHWIDMECLAGVAGIGLRAVQAAALRCYNGGTWKGVGLQTRYVGKALQVYAPSLPADLRDIWHKRYQAGTAVSFPAPLDLPGSDKYTARVAEDYALQCWKLDLIAPALQFPKGSRQRGTMLKEIAGQIVTKPNGKPWKPSQSTLHEWVRKVAEGAPQALRRKPRVESAPRVLISRQWDAACPLNAAQKGKIADSFATHIRSLWAEGAPSARNVGMLASAKLLKNCREAGWNEATLASCTPTRACVEKHRRFSLVATKEKNAKRWADEYTPRIQRTREGLQPGDIVVGDVHPMDVVREIDGRRVHARLISWLDVATYDLFVTVVTLPKGRGIRQEDVAASFVDMVEAWGLPRQLRLDHGKEFKWDAMIQGFQKLAGLVEAFRTFQFSLLSKGESAEILPAEQFPAVSRARPYNAPAKQIEHVFGLVEQSFFSMMPGWIGGDRMNKRTQMQGADPVAHEGDNEAFQSDVDTCLSLYRATPQADGRSPNDKRGKAIAEGWKAVGVNRSDLIFSFSERQKAKVIRGNIEYRGRSYRADFLIPITGRTIEIMAAKWAPGAIYHVDVDGAMHAIPEALVYGQRDVEGAKEQGRLAGLANSHIRQLKAQTTNVDLLEESRRVIAELPPTPKIPFGATITTAEGEAIGNALAAMALPAPVKLLAGQFQHPTDGHIVDMQPANEEGPKPNDSGFDPFNFSPHALEDKKAKSDAPEFDLFKSLATRYDTDRKVTP
jgi:hypothetical protein